MFVGTSSKCRTVDFDAEICGTELVALQTAPAAIAIRSASATADDARMDDCRLVGPNKRNVAARAGEATSNGGATFYTLWSQSLYDSRYLHTTGYLTSSDPNYKFRACYAHVTYHEPAWCSRAW